MQVGYEKIAIYDQYIGLSHFNASCQRCVACVRRDVMNTVPPDRGKLVTFIVGSSKWRLAKFVDGGRRRRSVHDKKRQRYAEDNRTNI